MLDGAEIASTLVAVARAYEIIRGARILIAAGGWAEGGPRQVVDQGLALALEQMSASMVRLLDMGSESGL
jgi:hypothetical protein